MQITIDFLNNLVGVIFICVALRFIWELDKEWRKK